MTRFPSRRLAGLVAVSFGVAALVAMLTHDAAAQSAGGHSGATNTTTRAFAQARPSSKRTRARTRIRVTPAYPYRLESLPYPPPYEYEYPGPNAVRQCSARLVQEFRPSGTVIVPRTTCWWERG